MGENPVEAGGHTRVHSVSQCQSLTGALKRQLGLMYPLDPTTRSDETWRPARRWAAKFKNAQKAKL
jgi:hypothetical protein